MFATYVGTYRQAGAALQGVLLFRGFFERGAVIYRDAVVQGVQLLFCSYSGDAVIQEMQLYSGGAVIQGVLSFRYILRVQWYRVLIFSGWQ